MPEYQSLYRKYRSQTFADLVGQDASSRALQGANISGRVAHAYLFSGSRGTGKTSAARLLAKSLNCTAAALIRGALQQARVVSRRDERICTRPDRDRR